MADEAPTARQPTPTGYDALAEAKLLLRTIRSGSLATLSPDGGPFASLVSVATLADGSPILLLSTLAAHTQHLTADARCALLLSRGGKGDPLAHPRVTLTGTALRLTEEPALSVARSRFLRRQPKAALYADFPDFGFFVLDLAGAHLNGGFARAARFSGADLRTATDARGWPDLDQSAVAHMNADHREALALYASRLCGAGAGDWTASGLDPDGLDLLCGDRVARLVFDKPVSSPETLRETLKHLADRARAAAL